MKKSLSILGLLLISSSTTLFTSACKNNNTKVDLKKVLNHRELGMIPEEKPGTLPTYSDLRKQLFNFNHELEVSKIRFSEETATSVNVIGDGNFYSSDVIPITFHEQTIAINALIVDGSNLGKINISGKQPTSDELKQVIHKQLSNVEINHIDIKVNSNYVATVSGDSVLYTGQVTIYFTTDNSVDINTIIKNDKPLLVNTAGQPMPLANDVISALTNKYKSQLNANAIDVKAISSTSATIVTKDSTIYSGQVTIKLQLDKSIALKDIINQGLDKVIIKGKTITKDDVINSLKLHYKSLNVSAINVELVATNAAKISSINQAIYTGEAVIINNLVIDLNSVLSNTLPTFIIPGEDKPTLPEVEIALKATNPNLGDNISKLTINEITNTSVKVTGDGTMYSKDTLTINYNCDKSVSLSSVFTNLDLGSINTNGLPQPSIPAITNAISTANPKLDIKAISIKESDINDSKVKVTGDNITYRGFVSAHFVINSSNINVDNFKLNHSQTNSVGSLKTTWKSDGMTLLANWTNYADDWDTFITKFSTLNFGDKSLFSVYCNHYADQKLKGAQLSLKTSAISDDRNQNIFALDYSHDGGWKGATLELHGYIHIWHDATNVYVSCNWRIDTAKCFYDRVFNVDLSGATFS